MRRRPAGEVDPATAALAEHIRSGRPQQATSRPARQLPTPLTPLIGREEELALLDGLLRGSARLVTLVGAGGSGKTRLALAAATMLHDRFADGAWWTPLAGVARAVEDVSQADSIAAAILAALGHQPAGQRSPCDELRDTLGKREVLLALDNCEHLPATGGLVADLLGACPRLRILATSRERLGVYGETLQALEGLPLPSTDDAGAASPAVQLFLTHAARHTPGFGATPAELAGVAQLCRLLDGLPLGIELAARWVQHYSCDEIATAVQRDLAFLATHDQHVPERQRSLYAVFDYSWGLLSPSEQRVLTRLGVFPGSFDRTAAEHVVAAPVAIVAALVDKSLLRRGPPGRYQMPELLRQFVFARLRADSEELARLAAMHSHYYLGFVAARATTLAGAEHDRAMAEISVELSNIHQAWRWAATSGAAEHRAALGRAAPGLELYIAQHGLLLTGTEWFTPPADEDARR